MRRSNWIIAAIAAAAAVGAAAQASGPVLLQRLERGGWELTPRDEGAARTRVCLAEGSELIQLRHNRLRCERIVVEDTPEELVVQYNCPGNGYGRTHIRRESDRLVQIDTQGIERGLPFFFTAEARWSGSCRR